LVSLRYGKKFSEKLALEGGQKHVFGIYLYSHPEYSVVALAEVVSSEKIRLLGKAIKFRPLQFDKEDYDITYLNFITSNQICSEDSYIQCDKNGPHRLASWQLSDFHTKLIKHGMKNFPTSNIYSIPSFQGHHKLTEVTYTDGTQKKVKTLYNKRTVTAYAQFDKDRRHKSGYFVVEYVNSASKVNGSVTDSYITKLGYIPESKIITFLTSLSKKVTHKTFNKMIDDYAEYTELVEVHSVPQGKAGLNIVVGDGKERKDSKQLTPEMRNEAIVASWGVQKGNIRLDVASISWLIERTYHNVSTQRDVASCVGLNLYNATNQALYVRATPLNGQSSTTSREKGNQQDRAEFLPLIRHLFKLLSASSCQADEQLDPVFNQFLRGCASQSSEGESVTCKNNPSSVHNNLMILTGPSLGNVPVRGYANGGHNDKNDNGEHMLNAIAKKRLFNQLDKCQEMLTRAQYAGDTEAISQALKTLLAISHVSRLFSKTAKTKKRKRNCEEEEVEGKEDWKIAIRAICGHLVQYSQDNGREVSSLFVYNSLKKAVKMPMNRCVYHRWNAADINHQTAIPYSFDSQYVYMNDEYLSILGWGW